MINAKTKLCAVIGNPVSHSMSPAIHNAAFRHLGLDYVYVAFQVSDLKPAISGMRALGIRGLSVTIPHKVEILKYLDKVDGVASRIGSVNTVVNNNGSLEGTSTDGAAALKALRDSGAETAEKNVLLIGSGGAARAIAFSLLFEGKTASILLLGIIPEELGKLSAELAAVKACTVTHGMLSDASLAPAMDSCSLLINCTPVGMSPGVDKSPVPAALLRKSHTVFDIVYNPVETKLIREAKKAGCATVSGVDMFVNQAALQFELWTGMKAPVDVMSAIVLAQLKA